MSRPAKAAPAADTAPALEVVAEAPMPAVGPPMTDEPLVLREWVVGMIGAAGAAFKKVHDDGLAEQSLAFEQRLADIQTALVASIGDLCDRVETIEQRLGGEEFGGLKAQVSEVKAGLMRVVQALGRTDIVTPPATVEQLVAALKSNPRVKILGDYKTIGVDLKAGRELDTQAFNHQALIDGVRCGKLRLSILGA